MIHRINLIGCSKSKHYKYDRKRGGRVAPVELYTGQLFRKRVEHSERLGIQWVVLSAKFGLWRSNDERRPSDTLDVDEPYNLCMAELSKPERAAWHVDVAHQLINELWEPYHLGLCDGPIDPRELHVEIHAGKDYCEPLRTILEAAGVSVVLPVQGLSIGQQLHWYDQQEKGVAA